MVSVCVLRCFFLTENARVEQAAAVDRFVSSSGKRSHESMVGIGISGTFYAVLMQCSPQIFNVINFSGGGCTII
jgi:hypothetical protein